MIIILGKTASGKDFILSKLVSKHGFHKIITYTSRPMRDGEVNGETYHFISDGEFLEKIDSGFFAEYKEFSTVFGIWRYGSAKGDYINADDKTVIILTPDGYRDISNSLDKRPISIYIYANNSTIKKRLIGRGDDKAEAERRLRHDNDDFKGFENEVDKIIYNNDRNDIDKVVDEILSYIEERGSSEK